MKTLRHTFTFLCILFVTNSFSQELTQTIKGVITDYDTQTTLPGANIIVTDVVPLQGAISDIDGRL